MAFLWLLLICSAHVLIVVFSSEYDKALRSYTYMNYVVNKSAQYSE